MQDIWTIERVLQLAPDPDSAKASQGLGNARKWQNLGKEPELLWGECQGSGAKPYQVVGDAEAQANRRAKRLERINEGLAATDVNRLGHITKEVPPTCASCWGKSAWQSIRCSPQ